MKLTVIGTVFVDIKGFTDGNFVPAGRNVGRIEQFHGGVGRNIAEDVAGLGIDTTFVSLVDEGGMGADVVQHLNSRGIHTQYVGTDPEGMGTWLAIFDEKGEVYANVSRRPVLKSLCQMLDEQGEAMLGDTDGILLEIDVDEPVVERVFALARRLEKPVYAVISNINIAMERMSYILRSRCFVCNRQEAGVFFRLPESWQFAEEARDAEVTEPQEMLRIMKKETAALGMDAMVVTMDAAGAAYVDNLTGSSGLCEALPVNVVDTTGAGDSFFAGVAAGLARGESLGAACDLGTRMAARVISGKGNVFTGEPEA